MRRPDAAPVPMTSAAEPAALMRTGWREWAALDELGITRIKAKLDTGARTSALQAFAIERLTPTRLRFQVHPLQPGTELIWREADLVDERWITDSGGHRELRPVIRTALQLGPQRWTVEVTLTARESLRFRLLLGRSALAGRVQIDPGASFVLRRRQRRSAG